MAINMVFTRENKVASIAGTSMATDVRVEILEQQEDNPLSPEETPAEEASSEKQ